MRDRTVRKAGALTLLETLIAMAIMACIFAALLPQFRSIQNSWDTKRSNSEIIQNSRVFNDFLNMHLSKAVKISSVSASTETDGYIEFVGSDDLTYRCEISEDDYIQFGQVGDLSDLAGPVSKLQFSCYTLDDLETPTTGVGRVRFVKVETTFTNAGDLAEDKDFVTQIYMQSNWNNVSVPEVVGSATEFDDIQGKDTAVVKIDSTHYLCAYSGTGDDGYAVILTVDAPSGTITYGTRHEFDTVTSKTMALSQIDGTHYLCAYQGTGMVGNALVLTVDISDWTISSGTVHEFDSQTGKNIDVCQVDSTHYLCAYQGYRDDGFAVILTVDTSTWEVSSGSALEYDIQDGKTPSLSQIDGTHYLCAYEGTAGAGKAVILEVDTSDWSVSKKSPHTFSSSSIMTPILCGIDGTHYLCVWQGFAANDGRAIVLTINTTTWTISTEVELEFDEQISNPDLTQIDSDNYLCVYGAQGDVASSVVLSVDSSTYEISKGEVYDFAEDSPEPVPDLCAIDVADYLCCYTGDDEDGWSVVLCLGIRP